MSAVIFNTLNGVVIKNFKNLGAAKGSLTKMKKKQITDHLSAVMVGEYNKTGAITAAEMVTVTNLIGGREVQIRRELVGTCCDPSTERYHSM